MKKSLLLSLTAALVLTACGKSSHQAAAVLPARITNVTADTFISGKDFCSTYDSITSKEVGVRVDVPRHYDDRAQGTLSLYAYTMRPFDPIKPSYIYVDGGPGQNTHGMMPEIFGGSMNEIRFDQRGLGCSTPDTFAIYKDSSLYSSENTIRDMELIRKAYGISKWSIYGLSYGTVPATMYASRYKTATASLVLEGVLGDVTALESDAYDADKFNLITATLNDAQRESMSQLMYEKSDDRKQMVSLLRNFFYYDGGQKKAALLLAKIITTDGVLHRDLLHKATDVFNAKKYVLPQQPGAIDSNIMGIIYCKNLGKGAVPEANLSYTDARGFYTEAASSDASNRSCEKLGVLDDDRKTYRPADFKTDRPVYYFQGSHDGATIATGALAHWQTVPQGRSYFLLANKGGHNPSLTRLHSDARDLRDGETSLFRKAMLGQPIALDDVTEMNYFNSPGQTWVLYLAKPKTVAAQTEFDSHLDGISYVPRSMADNQ